MVLQRYIPNQQEIDNLLTNVSAQEYHIYNLPIHAVDVTKGNQHSLIFKDICLCIVIYQLPSLVAA